MADTSGQKETKKETKASADKTEAVTEKSEEAAAVKTTETAEETEAAKACYVVGDIVNVNDQKIVYMSSGVLENDDSYSKPKDGYQRVFIELYVEQLKGSGGITAFDFECYADGYAADQYYGGPDGLSGSLTEGRYTTGKIYFSVPVDASEVEFEYEYNFISDKKIKFLYEGQKDSGYIIEKKKEASENTFAPGDVVETKNYRISYLSCGSFESEVRYIKPDEGYHFICFEFEFENISNDDHSVSSMLFECFADGAHCSSTSARDDDLSATLSAGRKTKGTVAFEVPDDAETIELEFQDSLFSDKRIIFSFHE
ncbi:MAG: DUF4352 domain-containing protein [Lachnospiraceae bacterium]|nr:DUF4352 domain-containing protein [Lachnospiraceae bacterium]